MCEFNTRYFIKTIEGCGPTKEKEKERRGKKLETLKCHLKISESVLSSITKCSKIPSLIDQIFIEYLLHALGNPKNLDNFLKFKL